MGKACPLVIPEHRTTFQAMLFLFTGQFGSGGLGGYFIGSPYLLTPCVINKFYQAPCTAFHIQMLENVFSYLNMKFFIDVEGELRRIKTVDAKLRQRSIFFNRIFCNV